MKALYIPSAVLALILMLALWTGSYIDQCTTQWLTELEIINELLEKNLWTDAEAQLTAVLQDWERHRASFHLFLEHRDLDETEQLFSGASAACRERDSTELRICLQQLSTQLISLSETQSINIQNIL